MELKKITDSVYYIPGAVNIGCIVKGSEAILIDTGIDDSTGKKILNKITAEGLNVKAVINTHSHADHCGGNSFIKEKTGALVYAGEIEEALIRYPYLEPLYLFSGAQPVDELINKFFMAKPSHVDQVVKCGSSIDVNGLKLNTVPLFGHSPNHMGIEYDGVLFCGDSFFSLELLDKHCIPYNTDIEKQQETLEFLNSSCYKYYIPAHCPPSYDISDIINANIEALYKIDSLILEKLQRKLTADELLKQVCDENNFKINNIGQYCLLHTALLAHLGSLSNSKRAAKVMEDNLLLWHAL